MPFNSVLLKPGVDIEKTPSLNEAGISVSQLVRFKGGLVQKNGGWQAYYPLAINSTVRDLHAWQGLSQDKHLAVGATQSLNVITSGSATDITPQTTTTNPAPNFSVSSGSNLVTVQDPGSSASTFDTVYFNTPVSVGTLLINGAFKVNTVGGSSSYTILATANSCTTIVSSGILPIFSASSGTANITVNLPNNGFQATTGLFQQFIAPSSVGGLTVSGPYQIASVIDSTNFTINANQQATTTATATMNGGNAQIVYYVTNGPPAAGSGYGVGAYGVGGYGTGTASGAAAGTPITTTDWTLENWGETLLACPTNGPIYVWSPDSGFSNSQVVTQAPFFNTGIFISMPQQILVAFGSCLSTGVQDPLVVRWSNSADYTVWAVNSQTGAGSFHLPTGSKIIGGLQGPGQGFIWTDIEIWAMNYVGGDVVFNFNRIGSGCGLIGIHAAGVLAGSVYWCGFDNFYMLGPGGVVPMPCTVWDFVFQNLDITNQSKVWCAPNSLFNEVWWFFPSASGSGENDSYVKVNLNDGFAWDYGTLPRTAWVDTTVLGNPIGADTAGFVWQHELTNDAGGVPMNPFFESGFWAIADGNNMAFVDYVIPDMIWGTFSGAKTATVLITFKSVNFPGDTPVTYGPFPVTRATQKIDTRIRGRLMSVRVESQDSGSFWRLGRIRYRWAPAGRQ